MKVDDAQLQDILIDAGVASRGDLTQAVAVADEQGRSLADVLLDGGIVADDDIRRAQARVLGIPFVVLERSVLDRAALSRLPEPMSRAYNAAVVGENEHGIVVALLDIADLEPIQAYFGTDRVIHLRLTNRASIKYALIEYQKLLKELFGARITDSLQQIQRARPTKDVVGASDAAVQMVDALLRHALHNNARHIHLEPSAQGIRVRYRLGESLHDAMVLPTYAAIWLFARIKSLANMDRVTNLPTSGRFKFELEEGGSVTVGVSSTPAIQEDVSTEALILSLAHEKSGRQGLTLAGLSMSPHQQHIVHRMLGRHPGLVLVYGEEGSGKTTMLYTLLDERTDPAKKLATVESHITYALPSVSQMEVNETLGLTPASCLRAQLRSDIDVLMIDCPLDEEMVALVVRAAQRGVLVLLGVAAANIVDAIDALLLLRASPELLSSAFQGAVGVRLVPKLCSQRVSYRLSRAEQNLLEDTIEIKSTLVALKEEHSIDARTAWKDLALYDAVPCDVCEGGYSGVIGLQEVTSPSLAIKDAIRAMEAVPRLTDDTTFADDALYKAAQGSVGVQTLLAVAGQ